MDPLLALMTLEELPQEKLRMMAQSLRGRTADGGQLAVSAIPEIAAQGARMQNNAQAMARDVGVQQARGLSGTISALQAAADMAEAEEDLGFSTISNSAAEKFEEASRDITNLLGTVESWRPEYQSALPGRFLANIENAVASTTGVGDESQAAFWSTIKYLWELPTRNSLFGSALTGQEKAEWDRAAPSPGDTPEVTRRKLEILRRLAKLTAAKMYRTARTKKWPANYLDSELGSVVPESVRGNLDEYIESLSLVEDVISGTDLSKVSTEDLIKALNNGQ